MADTLFRELKPYEQSQVDGQMAVSGDGPAPDVQFRTLDAPLNSVYDQDNSRMLGLPQTLSPAETGFVIKRDVDDVKNFFGMEDVGGFEALGQGIKSFFVSLPQVGGILLKEQAELTQERAKRTPEEWDKMAREDMRNSVGGPGNVIDIMGTALGIMRDQVVNLFGPEDVKVKADALIERNRKYMADAGIERPEQGGVSGVMYDIGQGGGSILTSMGVAALTRSPATAGLVFGAIQKASIYDEARAAGKTPEEASDISTTAGMVEGALEYVGLDHFMKALKGNTAVRRFVSGFAIEFTQEASQQGGEELITQGTGIRDKALAQTAEDILYQGFLGGVLGGMSNTAVGAFVQDKAKEQGVDAKTAEKMGKYAAKNYEKATDNLAEFIDKELAPIARDEPSAMEFMQLMTKFGNNVDLVDRESLDPQTREVFDRYVAMFKASPRQTSGIAEVEKTFYERAKAAGVDEDQAVASAKLIGARADAASRALGITPAQWLESKRLDIEVRGAGPQAGDKKDEESSFENSPFHAEAVAIKDQLERQAKEPALNREDPRSVARVLGLKSPPQTVLGVIRDLGGLKTGLTQQELGNIQATRKERGQSAAKSGVASGELQRIFDGKKGQLGRLINTKGGGVGLDEAYRALVERGYIDTNEDPNALDQSDPQAVLDLIEREANGQKVYPVDIEVQLDERGRNDDSEYLDTLGITKDSSVEEIVNKLAVRDAIESYQTDDDAETFNQTDQTAAGEQEVIAGAEKASDKTMAQRGADKALKGKKPQRAADDGLFDTNANKQQTLFQGEKTPRGNISFRPDRTLITLFKTANPSTILHELGHLFLRDMRDVSRLTTRPRVKADYEAVKKWLGATGDTLTVKQEEKFARGFEAYLREGKAPRAELQSVFDRFKEWLQSIYKSVKDLNVELTPEVRQVFDRMLGADYAQAETLDQKAEERNVAQDYETVANQEPQSTLGEDTGKVFRDVADLSSNAFVPVSTRLGRIDQGLKHAVRKFLFKTGIYTQADRKTVEPFVKAVSDKFEPGDYRVLDLALKNRDMQKVEFLMDKYDLQSEWEAVRDLLDRLYNEAKDAGIELGFIADYFPRKVKSGKAAEYIAFMRNQKIWSEVKLELERVDPNDNFTDEEKAEFVNSWLRGFQSKTINMSRPSYAKERGVDYVTPEFNQFYDDSMPTLLKYISGMRYAIESRRLFGKSESLTDDNIGEYVLSLVEDGTITADQEAEVKHILKSVVDAQGTRGAVAWAKNASYIYLMGNPLSAITQIQDLAFSLHNNGYFRTVGSLAKSLTGNQLLKKEDLGIDNILQEFEDETRAARFVRGVFKVVGLTFMDNVGKEVYIDAAYGRLRAQNKKNSAEWQAFLETVFGDEAKAVSKELAAGEMTENVKYLLFSELSDVQPISLAEMPTGYLNAGNGRVFYMLKTYTIKQLDIYRRQIFDEIASGDPKRMARGIYNLVGLGAALMVMGMGSDALKDLLLGRPMTLDDLVMDNMLKLLGLTKFQIYKSREEGIANTFWQTLFVPPIGAPLDDAFKDIRKIVVGKENKKTGKVEKQPWTDSELLGRVPFGGKFYYWWWGGGRAKIEKDKKPKKKVSTP